METYPRRFVQTSLVYLFFGVVIGVISSFDILKHIDLKLIHTHFNLLGFMFMVVCGVGYHILPRFNGTDLYFPKWVAPHFWIANIGLILMVVGFHINIKMSNSVVLVIGAALSAISVLMFVVNIFLTIQFRNRKAEVKDIVKPKTEAAKIQKPANWITIDPSMKVAEIFDKYPGTLEILIKDGKLVPLSSPEHINKVRDRGIPLGAAVMNHGGDLEYLIEQLEKHINTVSQPIEKEVKLTKPDELIEKTMVIGKVLEKFPATKEVFQKFFGEGCFKCPGQAFETVEQSAKMHNVDTDTFVDALNKGK
ncbi:MAG: DUF1858 domain-containing protein [Spirochaetota bacterium]|nr:DUF1858 domain-containing protein [Spirochaetota bacterium]